MEIKIIINEFKEKAKETIAKLAESNLTGAEKKAKLDEKMVKWAEERLDGAKMGVLLKNAVKSYVIANIPVITQVIFDLLAAKIAGITK